MNRIEKIWGHEEIIENNDKYCLKFLIFDYRWRNSWHRHFKKDETFYVLEGEFHLITDDGNLNIKEGLLLPGDSIRIKPGTWHRLTGLKPYNKIIEVSTFFNDNDIERTQPGYEVYGVEECKLNKKERYIK